MATPGEALASIDDSAFCRVRPAYDRGVLVCHVTALDGGSSDGFDATLRGFSRFLRAAHEAKQHFHFVFDMHRIDTFPLERLYELQRRLYEDIAILKQYLYSTVIVLAPSSRVLQMVLHAAFEFYKPVRPIEFTVHRGDDVDAARATLGLLREHRDMSETRAPPPLDRGAAEGVPQGYR